MENTMKYYKDIHNGIFAYEDDGTQDHLIKGKIAITKAEVDAINAEKQAIIESTDAYKIADAKAYLANTDYKMMSDYDGDITGVAEARAEARTTIRTLGETV